MHSNPFKRVKAMVSAIAAIMANVPETMQSFELAKLGQYVSRGHGRGDKFARQHFVNSTNWKAKLDGQTCGKRECARRIKQREAKFEKSLGF